MQISRRILWASLIVTLLFPPALLAQDADADAKLLEALKQKMKELETPPAATPPAVTTTNALPQPDTTTTNAPQQPAMATPAATAVTPVAAPAEAASPQDADKMREALRRKMIELDAEKPPTPVVPPPPPTTAKSTSEPVYQPLPGSNPPPATVVTQPTAQKPAEPAETKPAAGELSRDAAIAEAVAQANTQQARDNQAAKADMSMSKPSASQKPKSVAATKAPMTLPPLQGPPSSLNGSQQARLQALDQQYMSDLITSEQYHARRAKIISEP